MRSDKNSDGESKHKTRTPLWLVLLLSSSLLFAVLACTAPGFLSREEPLAEGFPTLMATAGAPRPRATDKPTDTPEPTPGPGLEATYTPVSWPITPTATISGSKATATSIAQTATFEASISTGATITPKATSTLKPTSLPLPTRTRYVPPPPPAVPTITPIPGSQVTLTPTPAPGSNLWAGQYFANQTLTGAASYVKQDGNLTFDWGAGSPDASIPADHFSARWTRTLFFTSGTYRFSVFSDDGVRVFLDNQLIIDQWADAQNTVFTAQRSLTTGNHTMRVEYYENIGQAKIQFWWEQVGITSAAWRGEYFANQTLSGSPTYIRNDQDIFFNWGTGSPGSGLPNDHFSIRWTREIGLNAGTYRFFVHPDDGVRVWVNGQLLIDQWHDATAEIYSAVVTLPAGVHLLRVDYYENLGDAQIQTWWEIDGAYSNWRAAYYANPSLEGAPSLRRNDVDINFDWGTGGPDPSIPVDNFSARWYQTFFFGEGTYEFFAQMDDGARIYVDGRLVVNDWQDGAERIASGEIDLAPGEHLVRVEYYERVNEASIRVWWEQTSSPYPAWTGEYFNVVIDPGSAITPVFERQDAAVGFNWGSGSPRSGIPVDNFSVRWTRTNEYAPGIYRLSALSDDGIRVYVNDILVIDEWHESPGTTTYAVDRPLSAGNNTIVIEYYEGGGNALVYFWTAKVGNLP